MFIFGFYNLREIEFGGFLKVIKGMENKFLEEKIKGMGMNLKESGRKVF